MSGFDPLLYSRRAIPNADRPNVVEWVCGQVARQVSEPCGRQCTKREKIHMDLIKVVNHNGSPTGGVFVPFIKAPM